MVALVESMGVVLLPERREVRSPWLPRGTRYPLLVRKQKGLAPPGALENLLGYGARRPKPSRP